ncbi:MAG: EAL domain-containing protein [Magnetococcales bacterium]|nr:EAL domain-containing protein [Magnetococcales bacterium]
MTNKDEKRVHQLHLFTRLYQNIIDGVAMVDAQGVVQAINPAFSTITGLEAADVVGLPMPLLRSPQQQEITQEQIWAAVQQQDQWHGQLWNRRNNGTDYLEDLTVTAIHNMHGLLTHYIVAFHDMSSIGKDNETLRHTAYHDSLTQLPTRKLYQDRLEQVLAHSERSQEKFAVMLLGLDHFKPINDSAGHPVGDQVLQIIATRLRSALRDSDSIGRMMGDEFGIVVRGVDRVQNTVHVARKLLAAAAEPCLVEANQFVVTASIGIAIFPSDGDTAEVLIKQAYLAMGRAKKAGRNTYQFYTSAMGVEATRRVLLEQSLRRALEQNEFIPFYQPKVQIATGRVVGMETLIRWQQPGIGMIPPDQFIPLAEETGLIIPIGEWILRESCRQTQQWLQQGLGPLQVAVNLSARQFQKGNLLLTVERILDETGLAAQCLDLEITESLMMTNVDQAIRILKQLHDKGISISVDDFGTGYSSLNYLKQFPIDNLKIDRSFMGNFAPGSDDVAIVRAIISMAHSLGLHVIAEGVETEQHLNFLRENGCDQFQGYYFSKPVAAASFAELLAQRRCDEIG